MRYARALAALLFLCAASNALALDRVTFARTGISDALNSVVRHRLPGSMSGTVLFTTNR